ncbi:MAG: hypothetical protein RSC60_03260 [Christensenellaceae bacterium]
MLQQDFSAKLLDMVVFDILPTRYGTDLSNYFRSFPNRKEAYTS